MKNLDFSLIFYLIINMYSYDYACHSCIYLEQKLISTIQNTPKPSKKFLDNLLKTAFEEKQENIIRYILLNTPINLNYQDELGNTWLHYAAALGNPEIVKILLQKDISRNRRNIFGNTALHDNTRYNPDLKIIKLLFMTGVNPDLENNDGQKAVDLYLAYNSDQNPKIITMLKKHSIAYFVP